MNSQHYKESFPPVEDGRARILILGSLPGDASLGKSEYYAHPRNAFWPIMADILGFDASAPYGTKLQALKSAGIALWDVLGAGVRPGSLDTSITKPEFNDLTGLLARNPGITVVFCNGGAAHAFLKKYMREVAALPVAVEKLPSTSPAAARMRFEEKLAAYREAMGEARGKK